MMVMGGGKEAAKKIGMRGKLIMKEVVTEERR